MELWLYWWDVIVLLRPAFARSRTFLWFAVCVAGLTIRTERMGVTSVIRALGLHENFYDNLLDSLHSSAINLDRLTSIWAGIVLRLMPDLVRVHGRPILVGDGIKVAKQGKKMPGVKLLHQQSESNTKPEYIMGHSFQSISILARADKSVLAVPLAARIHDGLIFSNRDRRTQLDKMISLLAITQIQEPYYFVADAYYASQKIVDGLLDGGNHLISRVKSNAVAYELWDQKKPLKRGRPRIYGKKVKLTKLFDTQIHWQEAASPVYGEKDVSIQFAVHDLLWRPTGSVVRFVTVIHPTRGRCILMSTDTSLSAVDIIYIYGLRFKIERSFKQAVHVIGTFSYHFWMKAMKPLRRRNGNQHLHRESDKYRNAVRRKLNAYHAFVCAGIIAQGLLHYLAAQHSTLVWNSFGSWLRTIRPGVAASELVVATALRQQLPEFLLNPNSKSIFAKFIRLRMDYDRLPGLRWAS